MTVLRLVVLISLVALTAKAQQNSFQQSGTQPRSGVPASCPVTTPPETPFIPPIYDEVSENEFPVGTEKLWLYLIKPGVWEWEPHKPGHEHEVQPLTVKISWLSVDYDWRTEPRPNLTLTGKRLDGEAPPLLLLPMTHIMGPNGARVHAVRRLCTHSRLLADHGRVSRREVELCRLGSAGQTGHPITRRYPGFVARASMHWHVFGY